MNFGDWIGPYIFEALSGRTAAFCMPTQLWRGHVTFTVGSILHWIRAPDVVDVWGSGIMRTDADFARPRQVFAVRGPRSLIRMRQLGYECAEVFGDPAILMPLIFAPQVAKTHSVGVVPHFVDSEAARARFGQLDGVMLIDVQAPPEHVVRQILACETILSSSLHGLIVAHAYGVPAVHLRLSDRLAGDGVKFLDYIEAYGPEHTLPTIDAEAYLHAKDVIASGRQIATCPNPAGLQTELFKHCPFLKQDERASDVRDIVAYKARD